VLSLNPLGEEKGSHDMSVKTTAPHILARKGGDLIKMITAYDYPTACIADRAEADIILVGDSVANVVLGYDDTLAVSIDDMVRHTAAVARAEPSALIVGDMPWLSYHRSIDETVVNAGRFIREGNAGAVKLEGGRRRLPMVRAVLNAEIPVMGHLGLTPQSVHAMGGYWVQGKDASAAYDLISDARMLADEGVFAIVLEGVPDVLAELVTQEVSVPTIGIGAGIHCDGQVLVFHDVVGLGGGEYLPKFVRAYASLAEDAVTAITKWFADVQSGEFPGEEETYRMPPESAAILRELSVASFSIDNGLGDDLLADEAMES